MSLALLIVLQAGTAQIIDDPKIGTYYQNIGSWKLSDENYAFMNLFMQTVPGLGSDKILGIETIIHPDNGMEAFNLTRQPGYVPGRGHGQHRGGGFTELFRFDPQAGASNAAMVSVDRSPCPRGGSGICTDITADNFFAAAYPKISGRTFMGRTTNRGKVKIDYICTANCPATPTKTLWIKLGVWNMTSTASMNMLPLVVPPANVIDMDAVIHSDPGSGPQVDNLEHMALKRRMDASTNPLTPYMRSRGGILWYGKGCGSGECGGKESEVSDIRLRLYAGHRDPLTQQARSSYRGENYVKTNDDEPTPIPYTNNTINRGWAKLEYTGTTSSLPQPFFVRTKVFPIGAWDMANVHQATIPFSGSGISPNRITGLSTVIRSDLDACGPGCIRGWTFTNFHRPHLGSGSSVTSTGHSGGVTYIDGNDGVIRLALSTVNGQRASTFYSSSDFYDAMTFNGQPYNRGYVRVDHLAAECADGTGGYARSVIGYTGNADDCHGRYGSGTSANFVIQTKGATLSTPPDAFYYANKSLPFGTNYVASARVMQVENTGAGAKSGVMLRLNTSNTSYHAAVVVTGNSVQFIRRAINGADVTTVSNVTAPCWVRVEKRSDTYRGYYSLNGTSWTRIGPDANITTTGPFMVGLASAGSGLTTSGFTNVSF